MSSAPLSRAEILKRKVLERNQRNQLNSIEKDPPKSILPINSIFMDQERNVRTLLRRERRKHDDNFEHRTSFTSISESHDEKKAKQLIRVLKESKTPNIEVLLPQTEVFWEKLKHIKTLERLEVKIEFQKDEFTGIASLLQESSLQHLLLLNLDSKLLSKDSNGKIEDLTFNFKEKRTLFEGLSCNISLKSIKIQNIFIDKDDLKCIQRFIIKNSQLEEIYLINNGIDYLNPLYDEMTSSSSLKKIDLSANNIKFDYKFFKYHKNLTEFIFNTNNTLILGDHFSELPKEEYYRLKDFSFHFKYNDVSIKDYPFTKLELNEKTFGYQYSKPKKINYTIEHIDTSIIPHHKSRIELIREKAPRKETVFDENLIKLINHINHLEEIIIKIYLPKVPDMLLLWEGIEKNHSLRKFKIEIGTNSIESIEKLSQSLKGKNIENLTIFQIKDGTIKPIIDQLSSFKYLKKLNFEYSDVIDQDVMIISKTLISDQKLKYLNLNSNLITATGAKYLFEALESNSSLLKLELQNNNLSKIEGVTRMLKKNKTLKILSLKDTSILNNDLLSIFEGLMSNQCLESISLDIKEYLEASNDVVYNYLLCNNTLKNIDVSPKQPGPYLKSILTRNIELTKIYKISMKGDVYLHFK